MDTDATGSETTEPRPNEIQELPLPADTSAPGVAREFVRTRWPQLGEEVIDDVVLIVSELASNAVQHGRPKIELRIRVEPFSVDVSVLDHGPVIPPTQIVQPQEMATSGRGLSIVDRLASDWGVEPFDGAAGKAVWARLRRDSGP
ncbi:MAG TPA: ATP-binding protein [Jatrophihabitans sp.]|jgi:anti-sigma regulatory factor (Ser/Thr protein kinase)